MSFVEYLLRRLFLSGFVVFGVTFLIFVVSQLIPSDPASLYAGPRPTAEQIENARQTLRLGDPLLVRFANFISNMFTGDFGFSYRTRRSIAQDLKTFVPATLELAVLSTMLALLIGVPLGVWAAAKKNGWADRLLSFGSVAAVAMPTFFLAMLLQALLSQWLGWLPLSGRISQHYALFNSFEQVTGFYTIDSLLASNFGGFFDSLKHLLMPALTLAAYPAGVAMRLTRSSMVEILARKHITAARALGIGNSRILFAHALPNAMAPALTIVGLSFAFALTGAVLVEMVFAWPGLGRYLFEAVLSKDFPVIAATAFVVSIAYVLMNLAIDLVQALIDPRITVS